MEEKIIRSKPTTSKDVSKKTIYRNDYIKLIQILKRYREKRCLSQSELGMLIGQDQTFISKYEKRIRRLDIIETLDICEALEIDMIKLLDEVRGK